MRFKKGVASVTATIAVLLSAIVCLGACGCREAGGKGEEAGAPGSAGDGEGGFVIPRDGTQTPDHYAEALEKMEESSCRITGELCLDFLVYGASLGGTAPFADAKIPYLAARCCQGKDVVETMTLDLSGAKINEVPPALLPEGEKWRSG